MDVYETSLLTLDFIARRKRESEREREGTGDKATSIGGSNKKTKTKEKTTELKDILISRLVLVLLLHLKSDRRDALCSER